MKLTMEYQENAEKRVEKFAEAFQNAKDNAKKSKPLDAYDGSAELEQKAKE